MRATALDRHITPDALTATCRLHDALPDYYETAAAVLTKQASKTADPGEIESVGRLILGAFTAHLIPEPRTERDAAMLEDPDRRRAHAWTALRPMVARLVATLAKQQRETASLEELAEAGLAYDVPTDAALTIWSPSVPDPAAPHRITTSDVLAGLAERVEESDRIDGTNPERDALALIEEAEKAFHAWQRTAVAGGRTPTLAGALSLARGHKPNSAEHHRTRRAVEAAVRVLAALAEDARRDPWHVHTLASTVAPRSPFQSPAPRNWPAASVSAAQKMRARQDQEAAWSTYLEPFSPKVSEAPSPVIVRRPGLTSLDVVLNNGTLLARIAPEDAPAILKLHDGSKPAAAHKTPEDATDAKRQERHGLSANPAKPGEARPPYHRREEASRSHKKPAPRKRSRGGQTGPTVPAGPHRSL